MTCSPGRVMNKKRLIIDKVYETFRESIFDAVPPIHQAQLIDFQKTEFGKYSLQQNEIFNQWMYQENDANKRLYCMQNQQVVAHQSAIAIKLKLGDKVVNAAYAIDLKVCEKWKSKGVGVAMVGALMNRFDVLIGLGVSDEAKKMFERQGWQNLGRLNFYLKPMNVNGLKTNRIGASPIYHIRDFMALACSRMIDIYKNFWLPSIKLTPITEFDQRHQELCESLQTEQMNSLERSQVFLNWRFCQYPGKPAYEKYQYISDTGELEGFIVLKESLWAGKRTLKVVELQTHDKLLPLFINESVKIAKIRKVDLLIFHGLDQKLEETLEKHLFYKRSHGARFLAYSNQPALKTKIAEINHWQVHNCESDMDICFR